MARWENMNWLARNISLGLEKNPEASVLSVELTRAQAQDLVAFLRNHSTEKEELERT